MPRRLSAYVRNVEAIADLLGHVVVGVRIRHRYLCHRTYRAAKPALRLTRDQVPLAPALLRHHRLAPGLLVAVRGQREGLRIAALRARLRSLLLVDVTHTGMFGVG